ncbi:MAG: presenilin family intramembrane aspartyl protease [Candidatus Aenigmatarchaeota archaeon]
MPKGKMSKKAKDEKIEKEEKEKKSGPGFISASQKIIILFVISQLIALFVGIFLIANFSFFQNISITEKPSEPLEAFNIIFYIIIGAIILIIVLKFSIIRDILILILEFFASIFSSFIVFFVFLIYFGVSHADLISIFLSISLYVLKFYSLTAKNLLAILAAAGVGSIIGFSLDPFPVIVLLFLVSIYDIIAVWFTRHMVDFAKYFSKKRTIFTVSSVGMGEVEKLIEGKKKLVKKVIAMELGSGDIVLPASLAVSSVKFGDIIFPIFVIIGATIGLYLVIKRAERERKVYPAMPSIAIFSIFSLLFIISIYYFLGWL